MKIVHTGILQG